MAFSLPLTNPFATSVLLKHLTSYHYGKSVDAEILAALKAGANPWAVNSAGCTVFYLLLNRHPSPESMDLWMSRAAKSIARKPWKQPEDHPLRTCLEEAWQPQMWTNRALAKLVAIGCPVDDFDVSDQETGLLNRLLGEDPNQYTWEAWTTLLIAQPHRETERVTQGRDGPCTVLDALMRQAPLNELDRYFQARNLAHDWTQYPSLAGRVAELLEPNVMAAWQAKGFDFQARDDQGNTLLHRYFQTLQAQEASPSGQPWQLRVHGKVVVALLEQGVTWTSRNAEGVTAARMLLGDGSLRPEDMGDWAHLVRAALLEEGLPQGQKSAVRNRM